MPLSSDDNLKPLLSPKSSGSSSCHSASDDNLNNRHCNLKSGKWGTECLNTKLPCCVRYRVKLIY